jgi:hypothetical protein
MSSDYRLDVFAMATEEKAPVEWDAERILGVRKARAYAIVRRRLAATGGIWHIMTRNGTAREGGVGGVRRRKAPRDHALDTFRARRVGTKTIRTKLLPSAILCHFSADI